MAYFVPTKHLNLVDPEISVKLDKKGHEMSITLTAGSTARLVECILDGADVVFSDNYFDLTAGRTIKITAPIPAGWTLSRAQAALKVRSVYDSYEHGNIKK
jgi:beta-mannosidase